jgi:CBF1 interacting corepressor
MGDEKARLGLAFMYNAPGSLKDQQEKNDSKKSTNNNEAESEKYEWGKNKPRDTIRNIQCLKCKRWGHANTDKSCPLYGKSRLDADTADLFNEIDRQTEAEAKKKESSRVKSEPVDVFAKNDASINISDSSDDLEITLDMLKALSKKEKNVLLKRLIKLDKKGKIPLSKSKK